MELNIKRLDRDSLAPVARLLTTQQRRALGSDPARGGMAAFVGDIGVGVLLFIKSFNCVAVEDINISPSYRRNGIGTALLRSLCASARKSGLLVTAGFACSGQGDAVYGLMRSAGLSVKRQTGFAAEISREALEQSAQKWESLAQGETPGLFDLSPAKRREFSEHIASGWPYIASSLRYNPESFDASSTCIVEGGTIKAVSLISHEGETPEISFLFAEPGCGRMAMSVLAVSVKRLLESAEFERLALTAVNESSVGILNRLCGDYVIKQRLYTAYDTGL